MQQAPGPERPGGFCAEKRYFCELFCFRRASLQREAQWAQSPPQEPEKPPFLQMNTTAATMPTPTRTRIKRSPMPIRSHTLLSKARRRAGSYASPNKSPTHRTAKATSQAMRHWARATPTAAFAPPISRFTAAMAATQGV